jgi:hypothetical protein
LVHIITYDLKSPNDTSEDYERLIEGLKSTFSTWCHVEKSVWLVETVQDAPEVRNAIKPFLHPTDILFVARLSGNWGSVNLGPKRSEWIKGRTF